MSVHATEKDYVVMECELDEEDGDVTWYRNDEEIKGDKRYVFTKGRFDLGMNFSLSSLIFANFIVFKL